MLESNNTRKYAKPRRNGEKIAVGFAKGNKADLSAFTFSSFIHVTVYVIRFHHKKITFDEFKLSTDL